MTIVGAHLVRLETGLYVYRYLLGVLEPVLISDHLLIFFPCGKLAPFHIPSIWVAQPPARDVGNSLTVFREMDVGRVCSNLARWTIYHIPGTQMTLVLIGKNLVLEGSRLKIEDISRFQVDTYLVLVNIMSPAFCLIYIIHMSNHLRISFPDVVSPPTLNVFFHCVLKVYNVSGWIEF